MNIILLGGPGAGKGTQSEFLINKYGMLHISTGDLLREAVANQTEAGIQAKKYMDSGDLVPDEVIIGIMKEKFACHDISKGLILDGFPRTVDQAESLENMLKDLNTQIDKVILIDTPSNVIVDRICSRRMCKDCGRIGSVLGLSMQEAENYICPDCGGKMYQRDDDNKDTVLNRIKVYEHKTAPLVDFYSKKGLLEKVDGSAPTPKEVFNQVDKLFK